MISSSGQLMIPPELMRKGRFDDIFFVGLPGRKEVLEILQIHISKARAEHKGRDPSKYDLDALADVQYRHENSRFRYTGAEYEAAWIEACFQAFSKDREPTTEDMMESLGNIIPISYTMKSTLEKLTAFGRDKCRQASTVEDITTSGGGTELTDIQV